MKIYYINLPKNLLIKIKNKLFEYADKMPLKRYKAYQELNDEMAKIQNILSYLLLRKILNDNNIKMYDNHFNYCKNGKPYFENSNIKFSISHSNNLIAVAIDDNDLGIDVEQIKKVNNNIINQVYSKEEQTIYKNKLNNEEFFCKTWTIKESFVKATGQGMNINFNLLTFNLASDLNQIDNYFINTLKINNSFLSICGKKRKYQIDEIIIEQLLDLI